MPTIKDLAQKTGLSVGTISRYLNGSIIKPQSAACIARAVEELGYVRNPIARSMKTRRTMTVAVLVPQLANMFSMRVIESIENVLSDAGYSVIVASSGEDADKQNRKLRAFREKMVDGLVLMPVNSDSAPVAQAAGHTPLVLMDRTLDTPLFDSVTVSNRETVRRYVGELADEGLTRIAIIKGPGQLSTARDRATGFCEALAERGLLPYAELEGQYVPADGYRAMKSLEQNPPQGLFISNYELTAGALRARHESAPDSPLRRIRIIGFDAAESGAEDCIRFICQPVEEIGRRAAELLTARMQDHDRPVTGVILPI